MEYADKSYTTLDIKVQLDGLLVIPVEELIQSITMVTNAGRDHLTIKNNLISIFQEWNHDSNQRYLKLFLKFVTGKRHFPIHEFPIITVEVTGASTDSLPTSSTCVHTLRVPEYPSRDAMKEKLELAIGNCGTFEFI